jgi:hypothetical protein
MHVLAEIKRLLNAYKGENCSITLTGHRLGATLSMLTAIDVITNGINVRGPTNDTVPVTVFGSPRVGDHQFRKAFESAAGFGCWVRNAPDLISTVLPSLFYKDVGVELLLDTRKSPYLRNPGVGPAAWHNLECYMHDVVGTQGTEDDAGFDMVMDCDLALVNNDVDALKDEYSMPAEWWGRGTRAWSRTRAGNESCRITRRVTSRCDMNFWPHYLDEF